MTVALAPFDPQQAALTPFNPLILGIDVDLAMSDLAPVWGLASGLQNLGNAWVRRLHCRPGGLFYDDDYGYDMTNLLNATLTQAQFAKEQQAIAAEIEKDERCQSCSAKLTFNQAQEQVYLNLVGTLVTGQRFNLIILATNATVSLLAVNGVLVTQPAATISTQNIQMVVGPPGIGTQGPPGTSGSAGTPQLVLDFDETDGESSSGNEDVVYQRLVNFGDLPASVTAELVGNVMSGGGTAIFQLRVGGTRNTADGAVVGTFSTASGSPTPLESSVTFTNPNGLQLVKITVKSSASTVLAAIYDRTVTIR